MTADRKPNQCRNHDSVCRPHGGWAEALAADEADLRVVDNLPSEDPEMFAVLVVEMLEAIRLHRVGPWRCHSSRWP
jgi:hypothetical protein